MYAPLLSLHSYLRWLALLATVAMVLVGWTGAASGRPWDKRARVVSLLFVIGMDLQFLVGLGLLFSSPIVSAAFADMKTAMKDPQLRFWAVEHWPVMLLAVASAHIGNARSKKAPDDRTRYRRLAVWATVALVLVLVSIPWPGRVVGRPLFR